MLSHTNTSGSSQSLHGGIPISGDDIIEVEHFAMLLHSGRHIAVRGLNLNDYSCKEVWLTVDQNVYNPYSLPRDMNATCYSSLMQALRVHHLDYTRGMRTVTYSSVVI